MRSLRYITAYGEKTTSQVAKIIEQKRLTKLLLSRYEKRHTVTTDKALYDYTMALKNEYLKKSQPLSKVIYDSKIHIIHDALGLHTYVRRVQGSKIKSKNEIRVGSIFKSVPLEFLRMIVIHELAHLKEKEHNKAFYKLCTYMEPNYGQYEFDMRLYMIHLEMYGKVWK